MGQRRSPARLQQAPAPRPGGLEGGKRKLQGVLLPLLLQAPRREGGTDYSGEGSLQPLCADRQGGSRSLTTFLLNPPPLADQSRSTHSAVRVVLRQPPTKATANQSDQPRSTHLILCPPPVVVKQPTKPNNNNNNNQSDQSRNTHLIRSLGIASALETSWLQERFLLKELLKSSLFVPQLKYSLFLPRWAQHFSFLPPPLPLACDLTTKLRGHFKSNREGV